MPSILDVERLLADIKVDHGLRRARRSGPALQIGLVGRCATSGPTGVPAGLAALEGRSRSWTATPAAGIGFAEDDALRVARPLRRRHVVPGPLQLRLPPHRDVHHPVRHADGRDLLLRVQHGRRLAEDHREDVARRRRSPSGTRPTAATRSTRAAATSRCRCFPGQTVPPSRRSADARGGAGGRPQHASGLRRRRGLTPSRDARTRRPQRGAADGVAAPGPAGLSRRGCDGPECGRHARSGRTAPRAASRRRRRGPCEPRGPCAPRGARSGARPSPSRASAPRPCGRGSAAMRSAMGTSKRSAGRLGVVEAGQGDARQALADRPLDRGEVGLLLRRDEGEGVAGHLGARGAADAVDVVVGDVRHVEVDDVRERLDVDAARGDVGRDEDAELAALEAGERLPCAAPGCGCRGSARTAMPFFRSVSARRLARCLVRVKTRTLLMSPRLRSSRRSGAFRFCATG